MLTLSACGGGGGSDSASASASASSNATANSAPTIAGKAPATVAVGQQYTFAPTASDADQDKLTYSIDSKPTWATFDAKTGMLSGTPTAANLGSHENIVLKVSDGKTTVALPEFSVTVTEATASTSKSATLSWEAPSQNVDGSALVNLTGYKIHYGTKPGSYSQTISIDTVGMTTYTIDGLSAGTYYFAITAVSTGGLESEFSGEASTTIG
jgi:hypothetical protein